MSSIILVVNPCEMFHVKFKEVCQVSYWKFRCYQWCISSFVQWTWSSLSFYAAGLLPLVPCSPMRRNCIIGREQNLASSLIVGSSWPCQRASPKNSRGAARWGFPGRLRLSWSDFICVCKMWPVKDSVCVLALYLLWSLCGSSLDVVSNLLTGMCC